MMFLYVPIIVYYTGVHVYAFIRSMTQLQHTYATTVVD